MEDKEIELLIEKKVAEAKFEVSETRLKFVLWIAGAMLVFFGAFVPIWQTNKASDKVDTALNQMKQDIKSSSQDIRTDSRTSSETLDKAMLAIRADVRADIDRQSRQFDQATAKVDSSVQDMQKQFKELAGNQLRKPVLELLMGGSSIESAVLKFSPSHQNLTMNIKNTGDFPARNIRIRLYSNFSNDCQISGEWNQSTSSDEPAYKCVYESFQHQPLDPKESRPIDIDMANINVKPGNYPSLLKMFYEQPEPRKYTFVISISDK